MTPRADGATRRARVAALLLIAGLAAGPLATHVYWMLGGTWGLGGEGNYSATGVRVVGGVVALLLVGAVLVVLAKVGLWQQAIVSDRVIRFFAWALASVFWLETVAAFTWSRGTSCGGCTGRSRSRSQCLRRSWRARAERGASTGRTGR